MSLRVKKKCTFYLSVNVLSTKVLIGDTVFYVSNWRRYRHFTWSSEPRKGLACCSAKGAPSFLGSFKTLSIGPAPGIEPTTSCSAVNTLYQLSWHCRSYTAMVNRLNSFMHNWFHFIPFFFVTRELLDLIKRCAQYGESNSVLLIGPRGSGKSLVRTLSKFCNAVKLLLIVCHIRAIPALLTKITVFLSL